jgi:anaerobic magnesium-protoporphyrin IX monomethyl ester cyclase
MKVLLVSLNLHTPFLRVFSIGFGAIGAYLKQRGHDVRVTEVNVEGDLRRLGSVLRERRPDVVGMNGPANQAPYFTDVVQAARVNAPGARVLIGGWHATLCPEDSLRASGADGVIAGEGELALEAYLDDLGGGGDGNTAPGLYTLDDGQLRHNPAVEYIEDLDSLPMVDYAGQDIEGILDVNMRVPCLMAGRGCPWSCTFCSNASMRERQEGTYTRMRSVDHVMEEVHYLVRNHGVEHVYFRDDTFTWNRGWALDFCERMTAMPAVTFEIMTRVDRLDTEMVEGLSAGGCSCVWVGVDAGDDALRMEQLAKSTTAEQIVGACDRLHAAGISVMTTNMVGLPNETPEMHRKTVAINQRIYRDHLALARGGGSGPKIFTFGPFPGTPMHDLCAAEGWVGEYPRGYEIYRDTFLDMPSFPPRQIRHAHRDFRYQVYRESFPARAWIYRLWDHGFGARVAAHPGSRKLLLPMLGVVSRLFGQRSG